MSTLRIQSIRTLMWITLALPGNLSLVAAFAEAPPASGGDRSNVDSADRTEGLEASQVANESLDNGGVAGAFCYEEQKLALNPPHLGEAVSISGNVAVMSVRNDGCDGCGSVNVFRSNGTAWVQEQKLIDPDQENRPGGFVSQFGDTVAVNGDVIAVGTRFGVCNGAELNCGSVYMYRFDGSAWLAEGTLNRPDRIGFASSVSVSGNVLVVGGYDFALVFRFDGSSWVEEAELTASDGLKGDYFGWDVAISGDVVIVGARYHAASTWLADLSGGVYLFRYNGTSWIEEYNFQPLYIWGELGYSVAIDGNVAVAARPSFNNCNDPPGHCGAISILEYNGAAWAPVSQFYVDAREATFVAVSGDWVLALWQEDLRAYHKLGGAWVEQAPLKFSDSNYFPSPIYHDHDGVALSGETGLVFNADCDANAGAYVYTLSACNPPTPFMDCDMNGLADVCQPDCNNNSIADACDISIFGTSTDCDSNFVPDECQPDCNNNSIADVCDIWTFGTSTDCDSNSVPDECQPDCNNNSIADICDIIIFGTSTDCDNNIVPDECQSDDCNGNSIPDLCDLYVYLTSQDTNMNGIPDDCELPFGDINGGGGVTLDDILCILSSFSGNYTCAGSIANADVVPCGGNGTVNLDDILAILQAFAGADLCP